MANRNVFDLSTAQRNALQRDGTILMDGVRYQQAPGTDRLIRYERPEDPQDLEIGRRGLRDEEMWKAARGATWRQEMEAATPGGLSSAPSPEKYGRYQDSRRDHLERQEAKLKKEGVDSRGQSQYYHEVGPEEFLGLLDLYEKRKQRGWS